MPTTTTGIATEFIQFTRASNATVTDSDGLVKWAPHNQLLASESFNAWTTASGVVGPPVVTANNVVAPNGTQTADRIAIPAVSGTNANSIIFQYLTQVFSTPHTFGVYLRGDVGGEVVWIGWTPDGVSYARTQCTLTTSWQLFTVNYTTSASGTQIPLIGVDLRDASQSAKGAQTIYAWGAAVYRSDLGGMQPNTSAYPMYNPTTPKNLMGYTEDFSNAAWTKTGLQAFGSGSVSNAILAPNGLQTADKIAESTGASGPHVLFSAATVVANSTYTVSVYVKAAERNFVRVINFDGGSNGYGAIVNLSDQTTSAVSFGTTTGNSYSVVPSGDGWYRISVTSSMATTTRRCQVNIYLNATTENYVGDGTSGIYLWGAQLSDSASLDSYVPVYGAAVTSAAYYGPRRDFDPVTLACKGLLVEEQRTNTILNSSVFSGWTKATATVLDNQVAGPDGTTTAGVITATAANGEIYTQVTSTSGVAHAGSIYVKRKTGTGSVYLIDAAGGRILVTASITTGSWTRISVTANSVSVNPFFGIRLATSGDELYIWGAQLEAGSFATSYIPVGSTTAGATRNADVASVSTQAFPYSATEGTLVANGSVLSTAAANRGAFTLASAGGYIAIGNNVSGLGATNADFYTLPAGTFLTASGAVTAGTPFKEAAVYKASDFALSANGAAAVTSSSGALPTAATDAYIGRIGSSSGYFNGWIRQITYLPRRISNADLVTRST